LLSAARSSGSGLPSIDLLSAARSSGTGLHSIDSPSAARSSDLGTHFMEASLMRTAMAAPAIVVCGRPGGGACGGHATERD
jgi:hypothetical protein